MLVVQKRIKQLGFTLIELMVVIAIMALLMAAGFATYTSVQKSSRDARRVQDLKALQDALEQYRAEHPDYPLAMNAASVGPYLASSIMPVAPTGGPAVSPASYTYIYSANVGYCICIGVENGMKGNANAGAGEAVGACGNQAAAATNTAFCLGSQQ